MINFDTGNNINPFLIKGALLSHENDIWKVVDMNKSHITIENKRNETKKIEDKEWEEIKLNDEWLKKFGLSVGSNILNNHTKVDWTIKSTGRFYYLTVKRDTSLGDNPVIGIKTVHELQEWFYRLTEHTLAI